MNTVNIGMLSYTVFEDLLQSAEAEYMCVFLILFVQFLKVVMLIAISALAC